MSQQPGPGGGEFGYVVVGDRLMLAGGLGLARAWRLLWGLGIDLFGSEGKDRSESSSPPTGWRVSAWRFARTSRNLARYLFKTMGTLNLPVPGDAAISRGSGAFKVLDLKRDVLYTVMTEPFDPAALERRVTLSRRAGEHGFAPKILDADPRAGWVSEQYVAGRHPTGFDGCSQRFEELYLPLLTEFLRAESVRPTTLHAYVDTLVAQIFAPDGLLERLPQERRVAVTRLTRRLNTAIHAAPDRPLALCLSHGDFFSGNLVIAEDGKQWAIDWANLGTRSPLHDLYFLVHNHCVQVLGNVELNTTLAARVATLRARLREVDPVRFEEIDGALSTDEVWRWVFYLECIQTPLERCTSPEERYVDSMTLRIGWFEEFEAYAETAPDIVAAVPSGAR